MKKIHIIDSHTGGEPTRLVLSGFPELNADGSKDMAAQLAELQQHHDIWRQRTILEPRGNDILVGALLCPPVKQHSIAGIIFFNNQGYLGMCGHGMIGVVASLAYRGEISAGQHAIDTPVGTVKAELHADGRVSIENVPAYRYRHAVSVDVPHYGQVSGDIAWGGNWFFLISEHGMTLDIQNSKALLDYTLAVQQALTNNGITGKNGAVIDHIELFANSEHADSKNFVLCPGGEYDRSPCGTGTSAKLACLAADGVLAPDSIWQQNSILDTQFTGRYRLLKNKHILPTITGRAHICAETTLLLDADDPLLNGVVKR